MIAPEQAAAARVVESVPLVLGGTRRELAVALARPVAWSRGHVTAIAWTVDASVEHLLLVRHRLHGWSCPGGHLEPGESPAATAARELAEETGVRVPVRSSPVTLGTSVGCAWAPGATHWTLGFVAVVASAGDLRPEPEQQASWFSFDALPEPRSGDIDAVVRVLERVVSSEGDSREH